MGLLVWTMMVRKRGENSRAVLLVNTLAPDFSFTPSTLSEYSPATLDPGTLISKRAEPAFF